MTLYSIATAARTHLETLGRAAIAHGGPPLWPAQLGLDGRELPDPHAPGRFAPRCYRAIGAPGGSNLYWDLPQLVAAHRLAALGWGEGPAHSADAFVAGWLRVGIAPNGLLRWGNHYFWDLRRGSMVTFVGGEEPWPVPEDDACLYHELRPLPVPWGVVARVNVSAAMGALRACRRHIVAADGSFDRHATVTPVTGNQHAFLESGAILALGWAGSGDPGLVADAYRVIRFSAGQRGRTGLLRNSPTLDRWDMHASTSELGFWAGAVARCGELLKDAALIELAAEQLALWLDLAWDETAGRFRGILDVDTGRHLAGERTTTWQPGVWSDVWEPRFPAHDYPMSCAEACLRLHRLTGRPIFAIGVQRWLRHLESQGGPIQSAIDGAVVPGSCAELYGRVIHFLAEAGEVIRARAIAERAMDELWTGVVFRGRTSADRYQAADGVGILILALLRLETGHDGDLLGFCF